MTTKQYLANINIVFEKESDDQHDTSEKAFMAAISQGLLDIKRGRLVGLDEAKRRLSLS